MRLVTGRVWAVLTIWQEARGEDHAGRVAVAEVIRNRMTLKYASDGTAEGTVLRPYQFSGWNTKDPNRLACAKVDAMDPVVMDCAKAWEESATSNLTKGAVLYLNPAIVSPLPNWAKQENRTAIIGQHHFYRA
jgi:cell wall hydrolase